MLLLEPGQVRYRMDRIVELRQGSITVSRQYFLVGCVHPHAYVGIWIGRYDVWPRVWLELAHGANLAGGIWRRLREVLTIDTEFE